MKKRRPKKKPVARKRKPASQPLLARVVDERGRQKELSRDEIDLLKRTVAKGTTDDEFKLFLWVCRKHKLDPLTRQVHCVRRFLQRHHQEQDGQGKPQWVGGYQMSIQMGIDGYRALAGRDHHDFGGCDEPEFEYEGTEKRTPVKATIRLWKKGLEHPVVGVAYWDEYAPKMESDSAFFWRKMPRHMLAKCAEALAIRKGYPELSDIYTDEEMHQAGDDFTPEGRQFEPRGSRDAQEAVVQKRLADYNERNKASAATTVKAEEQEAAANPHLDDFKKREQEQLERIEREKQEKAQADEKAKADAAAKAKADDAAAKKQQAEMEQARAKGSKIPASHIPPIGIGVLKKFELMTGKKSPYGRIWLEGNTDPLIIFDNKELPISKDVTARAFTILGDIISVGFHCCFDFKEKVLAKKNPDDQNEPVRRAYEVIEIKQIGPLEWEGGLQVIRREAPTQGKLL
ncbi:MAG: recombinase RecT [Bryobacteraceae bacterium]